MQLKNAVAKQRFTIIKLSLWITTLIVAVTSSITVAQAASSPINALVCSGGNHTPTVVAMTPVTGDTVNQSSVDLHFTTDWVSQLSVKRGATTLATTTGTNQANEALFATVTLVDGQNDFVITTKGGCPETTTSTNYQLNYIANGATIKAVATKNRSPMLFGTYKPLSARVFVEIQGTVYEAQAQPDYTWVLPAGTITPDLPDGNYPVRVFTKDAGGAIIFDQTYPNAITIDTTPPAVTISTPPDSTTRSPQVSGTVDDPQATITVTVNGQTYTAINNRDGSWSLPAGTVTELGNGRYELSVTATDLAGNKAVITQTLTITAPNQIGFILAPNTGYLRLGSINISSWWLYTAAALFACGLIGFVFAFIKRRHTVR